MLRQFASKSHHLTSRLTRTIMYEMYRLLSLNIHYLVAGSLLVVSLLSAPIFLPLHVYAQKVEIQHQPIIVRNLPPPGEYFELRAKVKGTSNPDFELRALLVSDGRLIDIPLEGKFDVDDDIIYTATIRAPLAELNYQFILYREDGAALVSKRYTVQRPCIPKISFSDIEVSPEFVKEERVRELIRVSRGLETDLIAYSNLIEVLKELQKMEAGP